jgi:hypothetical protein
VDKDLNRLEEAVNILAEEKGYRVVNQSVTDVHFVYVLMEKKKQQQQTFPKKLQQSSHSS